MLRPSCRAWFSARTAASRTTSSRGTGPVVAIMGSIVATETSTLTFISVPGFAYSTNFTFLQLVMGYMLGRIVIALIFIPAYFKANSSRSTSCSVIASASPSNASRRALPDHRTLADGFRLRTGWCSRRSCCPRRSRARRRSLGAGFDPPRRSVASVCVIGLATIVYTFLGGMAAVSGPMWCSGGLPGCAVVAAWSCCGRFREAGPRCCRSRAGDKFRVFDSPGMSRAVTLLVGVVGGMFLTTATHGRTS